MPPRKQKSEEKQVGEKAPLVKRAPHIVLASVLSGIGTAIAFGLMAAPAEFWRWATRPAEFPQQAIVFTTAGDCGKGHWEKLTGAEGRFIVAAGPNQRPGDPTPGRTKVKLKAENIPLVGVRLWHRSGKVELTAGDVPVVSELSAQSGENLKQESLRVGTYNNEEVDITPPGIALTVCRRKD